MNYPGGKNSVYQKIINLIPPHRVYIETHMGSAAIARNKRPAQENYLIDIDPEIAGAAAIVKNDAARWKVVCGDAGSWLLGYPFKGDEFIYCDPPYVMQSRRQHRPIYRYEYSDQDHLRLLTILNSLPCKIMISGYWSELYEQLLTGWHTQTYQAITRGGSMATEWLWMNYPHPVKLHEYSYLGSNFRERERIRRKKQRWVERLKRMDDLERQALLDAIDSVGFC